MNSLRRVCCWVGCVVGVGGLISCSGMFPDITSETPPEGHTFSSAQVRQVLIDQPFLLSGDYFLRRNPELESTNLFQVFLGAREKAKAEAGEHEKRLAKLEAAVFKKDAGSLEQARPQVYPIKIGFLVDYQQVNLKDGEAFLMVARNATEAKGAVYVNHEEVKEVLSKTDCMEKKDLGCVARIVGIYPGARFLHVVEALTIPSEGKGGEAKAKVSIVDTGLGYRYPSMEVEMPLRNERDRHDFLQLVATKLVEISLEKKNTMPWFCRAFSQDEGNRWFISAGSASGIREGDLFNIIPRGKIVSAPTGVPAGWVPENPKGTVRVDRVINEDLAVVSLASGTPPELEDFLVPLSAAK